MIEAIFQLIGELGLQLVLEILVELGLHTLEHPFELRPNPWLAAIGYTLLGAMMGVGSLLIFPAHLMHSGPLRIANLVITPILAGWLMAALGMWRARRGQTVFRIDRFSYGYLFALSLALVRYYWAA